MKSSLNIANRSCYLPLRDAVLCADCEFISSDRGEVCTVCGGINLLKLCDVLGQPAASAPLNPQAELESMIAGLGGQNSPENRRVAYRTGEKHV